MRSAKIRLVILMVFFLMTNRTVAQEKHQAKIHFDQERWTEYIEGNIPLVISVPHGGIIKSDTLKIRDCKEAQIGIDRGTVEIARAIEAYFLENYNVRPHIIINHLHRGHLDQNRNLENGASCGNKIVEKAWYQFRHYIDTAISLGLKEHKQVMYIDLHGHDLNELIQIGYNLTGEHLIKASTGIYDFDHRRTSFFNLLNKNKNLTIEELLFGDIAFGSLLAENDLPAVPSKQNSAPQRGEMFLNGGDNTRRFTGKLYPNVFGLQIECNTSARLIKNRISTGKKIAKATVAYLELVAGLKLKTVFK